MITTVNIANTTYNEFVKQDLNKLKLIGETKYFYIYDRIENGKRLYTTTMLKQDVDGIKQFRKSNYNKVKKIYISRKINDKISKTFNSIVDCANYLHTTPQTVRNNNNNFLNGFYIDIETEVWQ